MESEDSDDEDDLTPRRNVDPNLVVECLEDVLNNYLRLLKTKDRELLHYALFTFKSYHDPIMKIKTWVKLPEHIRDLYSTLLKQDLKATEQHLVQSWRYHLTYLKCLESVICSQMEANSEYISYMASLKTDLLNPQRQKQLQEF